MMPMSKQEFISLHNALLQNFKTIKLDINLTIQQSIKILEESGNAGDDYFLNEYRTYVTELFNMLSKTADYVGEMISTVPITKTGFLDDSNISFTTLDSDTTMTSCSDMTLIGSNGAKRSSCSSEKLNVTTLLETNNFDYLNNRSSDAINPFRSNAKITNRIIKRPKVPCGTMDTSIFKVGTVIPSASICSRDPNGLGFCIFINDGPEYESLTKLYNKKHCQTYAGGYPGKDVVFGMKMEDGIVRAVCCLPLSTKKVYLPDFGDIVDMEKNLDNIYHLTEEEQNIPGQAIQCQLHHVKNSTNLFDDQNRLMDLPLYERMSFMVHNILNGVLYLSPYQKDDMQVTKKENGVQNYAQITPEAWESLYEEPSSTTNALKAVLGHVPKDESRICPHYDAKTDSCFKGNNCTREHTPMPTGYFTKDKEPANVFAEKPTMPSIIYTSNDVLEVLVTHVKNLEYFFGIITDPKKPVQEPLLWNDSDVSAFDHLKALPAHYDIVLAKFTDGNWYRAEVIETYDSSKEVFVFYLDYGNRQLVHLSKLAKCPPSIAGLPAQAQLFRLANYHAIKTQESEIIKHGLKKLCDMLNDQYIKVCVVSHHEDLIVSLVEEPYCDLPKMLVDMHCVEIVEMY